MWQAIAVVGGLFAATIVGILWKVTGKIPKAKRELLTETFPESR